MKISEETLEEIRKEIPKKLQDNWVGVQNSFKNEDGTFMDFTELDEVLFQIIQFYRGKNNSNNSK